jgi:hypothetical protein
LIREHYGKSNSLPTATSFQECFGISNVTVPLDARVDNKIGTACDVELQRYFEAFLGDLLRGHLALGGGSKSLKAVHSVRGHVFLIPEPRGGTDEDFVARALGSRDGVLRFESLTGSVVDCARAFMSIVHG